MRNRRGKNGRNRKIAALLLAMALVMNPAGTLSAVYAADSGAETVIPEDMQTGSDVQMEAVWQKELAGNSLPVAGEERDALRLKEAETGDGKSACSEGTDSGNPTDVGEAGAESNPIDADKTAANHTGEGEKPESEETGNGDSEKPDPEETETGENEKPDPEETGTGENEKPDSEETGAGDSADGIDDEKTEDDTTEAAGGAGSGEAEELEGDRESIEEAGDEEAEDAEGIGEAGEEEAEDSKGIGEAGEEETEDSKSIGEAGEEETEDPEGIEEAGDEETANPEKNDAEDEILEGFTEMSSKYRLTSEQMESKLDLADHLAEIGEQQEGVDYVQGQIITFADTQEEAELIAEAYHAQIVEFAYGVLTLQLYEEQTAYKAMRAAAIEEINLPAVWPNYYRYAYSESAAEAAESVNDSVGNEEIELWDADGQVQGSEEADHAEEWAEDVSGAIPTEISDDLTSDLADDLQDDTLLADDYIEIEIEEYEAEEEAETVEGENRESEQAADAYLEAMGYSDPYLKSTSAYYQYHHTTIGSPYAWNAGSTGQGIKVAVLDTGVAGHTDVSVTSIFGQGTSDSQGHGTHVAGIIGAKANGRLGVGVAPDAILYSGNVLPNGTGTDADIMRAIKAAQNNRVDIINMSLGGIGYNGAFQQVVDSAYDQGIAIFAAAGNDGGINYNYPACYDHVISVAATDASNERAYFSNYGNKVDISAPGVNIYSTSRNGSGYVRMSGTSMACPVAAGEAAVILSGDAALRSKSGGERVDALEKKMKASGSKAGSGMGSGITMLPKALNLSTAAMKPAAPVIKITPDSTTAAQNVRVTIQAQAGMTIYYTIDGKTPSFKSGLAGNGAVQYTQQFNISKQAKATVKAIAVNESGVVSAVKSAAYTLKPYVSSITISGVQQIARGKSVQVKAEILPAYAANKKVTWELYTADGRKIDVRTDAALAKETGVSISASGKVTASRQAKTGSYIVSATAQDSMGRRGSCRIEIIDSVKIVSAKFSSKAISLVLPANKTSDLGSRLEGKCKDGTMAAAADFKWSSSNAAVARVSTSGVVTAVKPGKTTITALANDSSGKKAVCTVTVKQLATGMMISGSNKVAAGRSQTYKAVITPSYTSNRKVTWKLTYGSEEVTAKRAKELGVSINPANGKVTAKSKSVSGFYTVTATAADGSGISASRTIAVRKGAITGISFTNKAYSKVTLFRTQQTSGTKVSAIIYARIQGEDADLAAYEVTNSNPGIATVTSRGTNGSVTLTIKATGKAAGKTNITLRSTDGTNKKLTCSVTVYNPVSGIKVAPSGGKNQCVAIGKSLQLKAAVETDNGKVLSRGVTWEMYTASGLRIDANRSKTTGMKISANGKVTASKKATRGSYTVRAVAKDGSGVTGSYVISVGRPATYIKLYSTTYGYLSASRKYTIGRTTEAYRLYSDISQGTFSVSSSNPAVVSATLTSDGRVGIVGSKKGSATLTVKALDGSGKQVKFRFAVK